MENLSTLTAKQQKVLDFIREKIRRNLPPTIREIAQALNFSSTGTVRDYLKALEKKGFLKRVNNKSRAIELSAELGIPIIGRIMAGVADFAYEDIRGYINPDDLFLGRLSQNDVFALEVKGDSMIEAGIMPDDIALIKKQPQADNNDIIAALLDDNEVTLKRFKRNERKIFLEPANSNYQPIYKNFSIIGKLITIVRKY
ncbi:MAG: transcriptional repressor LexA [Candidatus Omnitrophota bacterium]